MRRLWQDLADLVFPADCAGCGEPRAELCGRCRAALHGRRARRVRPDPAPGGLPVVHAAAPYQDAVRAVLLAHKERGALGLAAPLGTALAGAAGVARGGAGGGGGEGGGAPTLLVPLPSTPRSTRARGHDPTRRVALAAARVLRGSGVPARVVPVLRQRRAVADQSGLNSRQRKANLKGALEVNARAVRLFGPGARVIIVDDLLTTGSSLAEAARALSADAGVRRISAAVIAAPAEAFEVNRN
ncbi:ComF family protein [Streptomyces physcomitrii]|uniref:ComF family protein n=1 Tax=Streptomyces physcomitrii TaxID=2724184 RepID=A0ABX1GVC0_9ACTN|nr:phosphoribosyltransferase family protein [Streptomyces physcomitrii]NKI39678.1 ComF family protein [Streptomyces physcomitrii]